MNFTIGKWLVKSPLNRLESRMLLEKVCGLTHAQILTHDQQVLSSSELDMLNQLLNKRLQGEPMAYLLGFREFYGREFLVTKDVLIPRPETEHLIGTILEKLPQKGTLWDLGTGSGIIGITCALERNDATIFASDVSEMALQVAKKNAQYLQATNITFGLGSWFEAKPQPRENHFYIIASNPPYIEKNDHHLFESDLRFEPALALTDFQDGLSAIRLLIKQAPQYLIKGGWLMMEHGFNQGSATRDLLKNAGFSSIETKLDLAGLDRVTLGCWL